MRTFQRKLSQNLKEADGNLPARGTQTGDVEMPLDILFGMKTICKFLGRSEPTIIKFMREYDDFPVRRDNGKGYVASRSELNRWFREWVKE